MNNKRSVLALVLVLVMIAEMFTGCQGQGKTEKKQNDKKAMGRYVEKEIGMPENAGEPVGIIWQDGKLKLYTYQEKDETYQQMYYENDNWSAPEEAAWLTDAGKSLGQSPVKFTVGQDKKVYAMTNTTVEDQIYGTRILTEGEDGKVKDITPKALLKEVREGSNSWFTDMDVWKDGVVGVANTESMSVEFYKGEEPVFSLEGLRVNSEYQNVLSISDKTAAVIGVGGANIDFYGMDDFRKKNTVDTGQKFDDAMLIAGADGIWYLVTTDGIQRITEEGSVIENIMDGGNGMMGTTSAYLRHFVENGEETPVFYGLYRTQDRKWRLMRYAYDKTVPSAAEDTLSIYSLQENSTVSQAIYEFQSAHPEVEVDYQFAAGEQEQASTDDIRNLNTELLSGNGADVLILDDLPVSSYMEKGILADLTKLSGRLSKEGVLIDVIKNTAQKDGKVYALPARIRVPVVYGTKEEKEACASMQSLGDYAQKHPDTRLFGQTSHDLIGMTLFHMLYDEIQDKGQKLDEKKLTELLEIWLKICENGDLKSYEEAAGENEGGSIWNELGNSFCSAQEVFGQSTYAHVKEITGLTPASETYTMAGRTGQAPESLKGYYVPATIAGVNASSEKKELAEEFVAMLFSETVQRTDNMSGLSVTEKGLDALVEKTKLPENEQFYLAFSGVDPETGEEYQDEYSCLSAEEMKSLIQLVKGLRTPFISDRIVTDTVLEEMEKCYSGSQTAAEAAASICQKVGTYLSE